MDSTLLLIDLIGATCLLMWGLGSLKSGMNLAFGPQLRRFLSASTRHRTSAFGAGLVATLVFQSSTAMAILASGFVAQGLIAPAMAQAIMLGANVGTSLVAQLLALNIQWLMPVLFFLGLVAKQRQGARAKGLSKAFIGVGLMFLSLQLISQATAPIRGSEAIAYVFGLLDNAPVFAVLLAAALAAVSASSLTAVLFTVALASAHAVDVNLCLLLVAGANLGGAIPPLLAVARDGVAARRVVTCNLVVRGIGVVCLLCTIGWILPFAARYADLARLVVDFHVAFNVIVALVALPFTAPLTRLVAWLLPDKSTPQDGPQHYLDEGALADPPAALAAAGRETIRIGDTVGMMLETALRALSEGDVDAFERLRTLDDLVDRDHTAVRLYLARLDREKLTPALTHQAEGILDYAMNLEHAGDIIEGSLARLLRKRNDKQLQFSPDGAHEIEGLLRETIDTLQLAQGVFLGRDQNLAVRLIETKVAVRQQARASLDSHLSRLQTGRADSMQTTSLHLDLVRDLKRINGHLIYVAYPILEDAGLLRESRLKNKA
jgi:phosphate:Na+ symporter